jgi:site-specific DNA recombinase
MVTTVIGYCRVSTEEQAASGLSLEAQRERIAAYCMARGWVLADVIVDAGASAATLERPGMEVVRRLMDERLVDAVVALKLDRLTRSVGDFHELLKASTRTGVAIVSVTENLDTTSATGKLMANILASMAEWERDVIRERTREALAVKRARGERTSHHHRMGEGERAAEERDAIAIVRELVDAGMSLRAISGELAARGHLSRTGRPYHPQTIRRMAGDARAARHEEPAPSRLDALRVRLGELGVAA